MEKICGIYKITSPSGKIYIGQSVDIFKRFNVYKRLACKSQSKLYSSFISHGVNNHIFEIIQSCEPEQLNELEIYYIQIYNCFDTEFGMNLKNGGNSGGNIISKETKEKQSIARIGRFSGENHPLFGTERLPETREKLRNANLGKHHSEKTKEKMKGRIPWNKNKGGYKFSEQAKRNMSKSKLGHQTSEETKEKIRKSIKKVWQKRKENNG